MKMKHARQLHRSAAWLPSAAHRAALPAPVRAAVDARLASDRCCCLPSMDLLPSAAVAAHAEADEQELVLLRRVYRRIGRLVAGYPRIALDIDEVWSEAQQRLAVVGVQEGAYRFDRYRSQPAPVCGQLDLLGFSREITRWAEPVVESLAWCRDQINTPAADLGPKQLLSNFRKAAKGLPLRLRVMDAKACQQAGLGALLAVGRASHRAPKLLVVDLAGPGLVTALCGKGVCFDSGGLNLKPDKSMVLMRKDMGGAATVLAVMLAAARLRGAGRLRAYVPLVENAIGPDAFRPGDILRVCDGTTVEVGNTDAEGRLILADAIALARRQGAERIVSVATLTGAALVALGRIHVPIMGDDEPVDAILAGATASGEKCWRLPLDDDHLQLMRGQIGDLRNDGNGEAGCITAGAFLRHFAGTVPFAHADISPASWRMADDDQGVLGGTGVLVTSLLEACSRFR